jgi:spoIIIJ-associated protein
MDFVETEGDTIDHAIDNALRTLGVGRDKVTLDILSEGRKGIFGFGAQKARVRATLRKPAPARGLPDDAAETLPASVTAAEVMATTGKAKAALEEILKLMGIAATVETKAGGSNDEIVLDVRADNNALLIGRKGQTLEALEYLVIRIAGERPGGEAPHIVVDVENYRERRRKSLQDLALRMGEKAKRQRKTVTVDALSAADRRIIHAALQDDPWVTTRSLGQGSYRRLLIIPEGDRRKKDEPAPAATGKTEVKQAK